MAGDNKTLGRFTLDGITPAPRGVPQIEVIFDIDANGIVNVKAVDKATNKEQTITITASTNLSKDDIEKAVKDAEQFAEEDKKRKEEVEIRNNAENLAFQSEKALEELKDKVSEEDVEAVKPLIEKVRETLKGTDIEAIKTATEELSKKFGEISTKAYEAAAAEAQANAPTEGAEPESAPNGEEFVDADFTEVDDNK